MHRCIPDRLPLLLHPPAAAAATAVGTVLHLSVDYIFAAVNVLADHIAANNMSARHISELRRDLVPDPDIALLAQLSTAAGITLRCEKYLLRCAVRKV